MPMLPEPAWLVAKVDQRLAMIREAANATLPGLDGNVFDSMQLVMTPLSEPVEGASKEDFARWDRSCDNCGKYCPRPSPFYTGQCARTWGKTQIIITFGVCPQCKAIET